ncbi:inner-membrane translocator [Ferroglobus placidus DSM 10642]|uniref:Inner-membrane translocator n=1 Tax=Ferroglobus placidus (strain DSM 10642 / AEDII12DO) TaxID=589924 RepID=D3S107_FERPA|nr:branched-chain amino acid ABC transporter permease [Ferroglobus placidus]ADC64243.1 inner-membrane translocator [Ferroglobus placidus DSM 10642]
MALTFLENFFIFSVFASLISFNFRIGKFLNLSLYSAFSIGAYLVYFSRELSIPLAFLLSFLIAYPLFLLKERICRGIMDATIVSLGYGIAIEEILRITVQKGYYYVVSEGVKALPEVFIAFYSLLLAFYISPHGIRLKFIEEDEELARMCGVNSAAYSFASILIATFFAIILGIVSSEGSAIHPRIGLSYMLAGILIAAIAAIKRSVGERNLINIIAVSLAASLLLEVFA